MKQHYVFATWSLAFFFGWVLAFPYYGAVLKAAPQTAVTADTNLVLIFLLFHALSYLTGALALKRRSIWKRAMLGSLVGMISINTALWFSPAGLWLPGMALLGFVSSFYVLGWSCLYGNFSTAERMKLFSLIIIRATLITAAIAFLSLILPPAALLAATLAPLIAALGLFWKMNPETGAGFAAIPPGKEKSSGTFMLILCLFIAGLYLNTGFMFSVVHHSYTVMEDYRFLLTFFRYIPYLLTFAAILRFTEQLQKYYLVSTGVSLLGLAFVSFALLGDSITGFFITITVFETAFALINLFVWTLLGDLTQIYGSPYRFLGFGVCANIASTTAGGMFGNYLIEQGDSPQLLTALFAAAAIFLTLIILPWLKEKVPVETAGLPPRGCRTLLPVSTTFLDKLAKEAELTAREQEIVELLLQGIANRVIAGRLFISENTLKTHLRNIYRKFGVNKKSELLARAAGRKWTQL